MEEKMKDILFDEIYCQINHKELHNKSKSDRDHELKTIYEQKTGTSFSLETDDNRKELYEWLKKQVRYPLLNDLIKSEIELLVDPEVALKLSDEPKEDQFVKNNLSTLINIIRIQIINSLTGFLIDKRNIEPSKITEVQREEIISEILLELDPSGKWLSIYCEAKEQGKIIDLNECTLEEKKRLAKNLELGEKDLPENACVRKKNLDSYILLSLEKSNQDIINIIHEFGHYLLYYFTPHKALPLTLEEFYPILFEQFAKEHLKRMGVSEEELFAIGAFRLQDIIGIGEKYSGIYDYIGLYLENEEIEEDRDVVYCEIMLSMTRNIWKKRYGNRACLIFPQMVAYSNCDSCIEKIISNPLELKQTFSYIIAHYLAEQGIEHRIQDSQMLEKLKEYAEDIYNVDPYEIFKTVGCDVDRIGLKPSVESKEKSLGKKQ